MVGDGSDGQDRAASGADRIAALERELEWTREMLRLEQLKLEQTEAALWQMSVLFGNVPLPVILMDADGIITDVNHEAERVFATRRERLLGQPLRSLVPADRQSQCEAALGRCREGRVVRGVEQMFWDEAVSHRARASTLFPIRGPLGRVVGVALAEDIQELKDEGELLHNVNRQLRQLASIDPLTGLSNRREYERVLEREVGRAARNRRTLSLAMIDVDDFKAFNDLLGHAAGDECLTKVAGALRGCLHRPGDFVARYGGEEFVAVLPGTGTGGGRLLAERMRRSIEALAIRHPRSKASAVVTVSLGIATVRPAPGFDGRALQESADRALYAAKQAGRNRVSAEELALPEPGREDPRSYRHESADE